MSQLFRSEYFHTVLNIYLNLIIFIKYLIIKYYGAVWIPFKHKNVFLR